MVRLIKLSHDKLKKDGVFIVETVNPMCLSVFALSFYMDPSHINLSIPIPWSLSNADPRF